jgi:ABC-type amino acid transport system permease subunit
MDTVLTTGSAAALASLLVNLFKLGLPAAPAWALVGVALGAGIGAELLVALANGVVLDAQALALHIALGIFAAGAAAGLDRTAVAAAAKREAAES